MQDHQQKRLVLVVDDDKMLEEYIQAVLARHKYATKSFTDPEEALTFFSKKHDDIDLIITDIKMPKVDGLALGRKATEIKPDIPIVFVSSDSEKLDQASFMPSTHACFVKPVSRDKLMGCVEGLLNGSKET